MNLKISFHGAAKTVTGSQFLLQVQGKKILVECGLTQGKRKESYELNKNFRFPDGIKPADIDAVVLTHAHIDHSGNLPSLVKQGFRGEIHATETTVQLCRFLLNDSAYLQNADLKITNKNRQKNNQTLFEPLYTGEDVDETMKLFVSHKYREEITLFDNIKIKFRDAGHILGSAGIIFYIGEGEKPLRLGFSGDIGRENVPLMRDPDVLRNLDFLIMETTYGNRLHSREFEAAQNQLAQAVTSAIDKQGGTILIPAFSVGRMQLLIYVLHKLRKLNFLRNIPIFVDSPLGLNATNIFRNKLNHLDEEVKRYFREDLKDEYGNPQRDASGKALTEWSDPFDFEGLHYIKSAEESMRLVSNPVQPRIIISSSGMMEGGRILHHLANYVEDPKTTLLFVGYAAQHTLARYIMDGAKDIKIYGEAYKVKCKVQSLDSFSAHADKSGLENYLSLSPSRGMKKLFLVHGEQGAAEEFLELAREKGYKNSCIPELDEEYSFDLEINKYSGKYEAVGRSVNKPKAKHSETAKH